MQTQVEAPAVPIQSRSVVTRVAQRYGVDPDKMLATLKATAFKQASGTPEVSNEQMMALLVIADEYNLSPFLRQIFAFPAQGGIVPVVSIDGWSRIVNEHPQFDGVRFETDEDGCKCIMYRRDRSHPIEVTEYFVECKRNTAPWQSHPRRMTRHKAYIQCARLAFGFSGIYDEEEARQIIEGGSVVEAAQVNKVEETRKRLQRQSTDVKPIHVEPKPAQEEPKGPTMVDGETGEIFSHIEDEKQEQRA